MSEICEMDGCGQAGDTYPWADNDGGAEEWVLCPEHAAQVGFCPACDCYMGGADDDWLAQHGVCYECWGEIDAEQARIDEDGWQ